MDSQPEPLGMAGPPLIEDAAALPADDSTPGVTTTSGDRDPLDRVAEEFVERCRRGEAPTVAEYEARFPDQAEKVRKLLGAVAMMEQLRRGSKQARFMPERIGEFRVLRELGRGGMGVVYEAVQESLWRHVAVKAIHHTQLDMKRLQRFQREAQAVAQLHHTNIVPIFGVGEHEGIPYYAMQYIKGRGLDALLDAWRADPTLPRADRWRLAARFAAQAGEALGYAHEQGVLHRDIKPANLLIDEHDAVWITDFGLAKMVGHEELTASGDVIGTLRYLAPESLRGVSEGRSDVYSLGLTLYEMVTLAPPFGDLTPSELLHKVSVGQPVRPRQVDPSIPRDLETIILKATARDLKDRYPTARALGDDLRSYLDDRPIRARQANFAERAWRWSRRNRATAALTALAAASLILAAVVGWIGYVRTREALASASANLDQSKWNVSVLNQLFEKVFDAISPADQAEAELEREVTLTQPLVDAGERFGGVRTFADQRDGRGMGPGPGPGPGPGSPAGPGPGRGAMFDGRFAATGPGPGPGRPGAGGPGRDGFGPPDDLAGGPPPPPDEMGGPGSAPEGADSFGLSLQGRRADTLALLESVMETYDRFTQSQSNRADARLQGEAAWIYYKMGTLYERFERSDEADRAFDRTLKIYEALATTHAGSPEHFPKFLKICATANPWQEDRAVLLAVQGRLRRMELVVGRLLAAAPGHPVYLRTRVQLLAKLGLVRYRLGEPDASTLFGQAIDLAGSLISGNPEEGYPHSDRSDVLEAQALTLEDQAIDSADPAPVVKDPAKKARALQLLDAAMQDLEWVAADGLKSISLATRMESLADDFERLGEHDRSDQVQQQADKVDPRVPFPNRPRPGRPFGPRRLDAGPGQDGTSAP